jgi:hypothetical protein
MYRKTGLMKRKRISVAVLLAVAGLARAATWTGVTNEWLNANAWNTGDVPNAVGEYAVFGDSSEYNVDVGSTVVLGRTSGSSLTVSGTGSYTFGGAGTIQIERSATYVFANDMYFTTTGETVFNVPVVSTRSEVGSIANRFRVNAGSVQFNQPISWSNTSFQLHHSSADGSIQVNGGMTASTANKELWLWTAQPAGISINSTISSSVSSTRITIANGAGTVRFANPSGVAADGSLARVGFNDGSLELGANNQIATVIALVANGGTLDLNGYSNSNSATLAMLATTTGKTLTIDFSDAAAESLYFQNSSDETWEAGNVLNLAGFEFGVDKLRFGTGDVGLTSEQLGRIRVDGEAIPVALDSDGFLVKSSVCILICRSDTAGTAKSANTGIRPHSETIL